MFMLAACWSLHLSVRKGGRGMRYCERLHATWNSCWIRNLSFHCNTCLSATRPTLGTKLLWVYWKTYKKKEKGDSVMNCSNEGTSCTVPSHGSESWLAIMDSELSSAHEVLFKLMGICWYKYMYIWHGQSEQPNYLNFQTQRLQSNKLLQNVRHSTQVKVISE